MGVDVGREIDEGAAVWVLCILFEEVVGLAREAKEIGRHGNNGVTGEFDGGKAVEKVGEDDENVGPASGEDQLGDGEAAVPDGFDVSSGVSDGEFNLEEGPAQDITTGCWSVVGKVVEGEADVLKDGMLVQRR